MLTSLLWLSPSTSQDTLNTLSDLLKGEAHCSKSEAASRLKGATAAQCKGVLCDDELRAELATLIETTGPDVSNDSVAAVVDKLGMLVAKRIGAVKVKAKTLKSSLKLGTKMPKYADFLAKLPKDATTGDILKTDWVLWHTVGNALMPKEVPALAESLLSDRLAIATCAGSGPVAKVALALHTLENMEAYVAWESSLAGGKAAKVGLRVCKPFAQSVAQEVSVRKTLCEGGIPPAAAATAAARASKATDIAAVLKELAAEEKAVAFIPLYMPPSEPKEPKKPKDKEANNEAEKGAGKKDNKEVKGGEKVKVSPPAAAASSGGPFGKMYASMATQEFHWQLLQYQMRPRTALSEATVPHGVKMYRAPCAAKVPDSSGAGSQTTGIAQGVAGPATEGFAAVWAPASDSLPPGHTPYSWQGANAVGMTPGFANIWEPIGQEQPPGHTPYSWSKVQGS